MSKKFGIICNKKNLDLAFSTLDKNNDRYLNF